MKPHERDEDWLNEAMEEIEEADATRKLTECFELITNANNIPFTWQGDSATPYTAEIIEKALELADRKDLLIAAKKTDNLAWLLNSFYVTDEIDTESLTNKYGQETELVNGETYFLCKI